MKYTSGPVYYEKGEFSFCVQKACGKTMAERILDAHGGNKIRFDALISHDITYVGIIQTARASGMTEFPVPYAFTNCHNSLCAVGGTINADDHAFGLSAAKKYGGIYVPANLAVIHQYAREQMAFCGGMILGSDSHTRYGALGTLGIGEGGPELVKQLLKNTYNFAKRPEIVLVYLTGKPKKGVGPHDMALKMCREVYDKGLFKNKILEFVGPGIQNFSMDFRIGVDVMTTETACLSSIWETDEKTQAYYEAHNRPDKFRKMAPEDGCAYDAVMEIDLSEIEPMIAFPFHPSNAFSIRDLNEKPMEVLKAAEKAAGLDGELLSKWTEKGLLADQFVIAGCAGGLYENLVSAASILDGAGAMDMTVYPASVPVETALIESGALQSLISSGAILKPCFCGPCFGAGDVPQNMGLSLRHTTRNFPFREGAKPNEGQRAFVALMDARSIAASAKNGGFVTGADTMDFEDEFGKAYLFNDSSYQKRVINAYGKANPDEPLVFGPNIADWPEFAPMEEDLRFTVASVLLDAVTTTDELIPSGETSSYRSNPHRLSEFALSRRDPGYVKRSKALRDAGGYSAVCANCPGDGSAREQAASCQRVLGGIANIAVSYATKRYRANLINWGIVPFVCDRVDQFEIGDEIVIEKFKEKLLSGERRFISFVNGKDVIVLSLPLLTDQEAEILVDGCLMNHYRKGGK